MSEVRELRHRGSQARTPDEGTSLVWLAVVLLRGRRVLLWCATVGVVVSLAICLLRRTYYTTSFSFLPTATQDQSRAGLASLAGQFGISLAALAGAQQPPQLYADLLTTRGILGPIADDSFAPGADSTQREPLAQYFKINGEEAPVITDKTLRKLREDVIRSSVATRTTGMVTVQVRTKSRYVSLAIANRLLAGLNDFNLVKRQSQAREERRFTEGRLEAARVSLRTAEDEMQRFLQSNRQAESPALAFQRERLQREVTFRQQVVTSLAQQYEENRIREVRDTPVITVIEAPILAARPDPRHRVMIMILGTMASLAVGMMIVIIQETWTGRGDRGPDPALAELVGEWNRTRGRASS